jgi:hypothetical protein
MRSSRATRVPRHPRSPIDHDLGGDRRARARFREDDVRRNGRAAEPPTSPRSVSQVHARRGPRVPRSSDLKALPAADILSP